MNDYVPYCLYNANFSTFCFFAVEENTESVDHPLHDGAKRGNLSFVQECLQNKVFMLLSLDCVLGSLHNCRDELSYSELLVVAVVQTEPRFERQLSLPLFRIS